MCVLTKEYASLNTGRVNSHRINMQVPCSVNRSESLSFPTGCHLALQTTAQAWAWNALTVKLLGYTA